ncbi:hypothetical protein HN512_04870 [Candidatus Peregrinibacteria bacterium]|jgi:hypothetical protein|nr:hypothetical protein [Candidatus Peregrinibacteria bacterium]MBT3599138.1 hypothetical protein [Candidatus Peregrinibacteria bacterium]MBT4367447.1 hypothetical protein [Candidatus Peregrinibacteria bacterium]MBT4585962.1 hypothetical protein [Candidatus Peregrinibacteria bacterium]MBT6730778.1 hypothetical protein [Candidatus Peregrinibacteria bacterium]
MKPRDIIAKSWALTRKESQLRRWGFIHAFLRTLLNSKLFFYQGWLAYSYFVLGDPIGFGKIESVLWNNLPHWIVICLLVLFILLLISEFLFPHMAKGAVIGLAAKSYNKEEVKGGLVLAIYNFFPIFALHEILILSSFTTTVTLCSLSLRYGGGAGPIFCVLLAMVWFASNIMEFFWIFSEEAIVVKKLGIRAAIRQSFKLVISHLGHVVFLSLLLLVIVLRIIANLLMIILIPGIIFGLGFLLATLLPPVLSYSLSAVIGIIIIMLASYFFAYLEVFRQTVWTITYMELSRLKELDVIEAE